MRKYVFGAYVDTECPNERVHLHSRILTFFRYPLLQLSDTSEYIEGPYNGHQGFEQTPRICRRLISSFSDHICSEAPFASFGTNTQMYNIDISNLPDLVPGSVVPTIPLAYTNNFLNNFQQFIFLINIYSSP